MLTAAQAMQNLGPELRLALRVYARSDERLAGAMALMLAIPDEVSLRKVSDATGITRSRLHESMEEFRRVVRVAVVRDGRTPNSILS